MRAIVLAVTAGALLFSPLGASAQTAPSDVAAARTDALKQCLQRSAGAADKQALLTWMFSAMSAHPDISGYASFNEGQRTAINKGMAALFQRLMTVDCRTQTAAVIRHNGTAALEDGFSALGELAMTELMAHPAVETQVGKMANEVDPAALQALSKEIASAKE